MLVPVHICGDSVVGSDLQKGEDIIKSKLYRPNLNTPRGEYCREISSCFLMRQPYCWQLQRSDTIATTALRATIFQQTSDLYLEVHWWWHLHKIFCPRLSFLLVEGASTKEAQIKKYFLSLSQIWMATSHSRRTRYSSLIKKKQKKYVPSSRPPLFLSLIKVMWQWERWRKVAILHPWNEDASW
jgi:hypothetical protein